MLNWLWGKITRLLLSEDGMHVTVSAINVKLLMFVGDQNISTIVISTLLHSRGVV